MLSFNCHLFKQSLNDVRHLLLINEYTTITNWKIDEYKQTDYVPTYIVITECLIILCVILNVNTILQMYYCAHAFTSYLIWYHINLKNVWINFCKAFLRASSYLDRISANVKSGKQFLVVAKSCSILVVVGWVFSLRVFGFFGWI